jgi:hypothetical protein
MAVAGWMLVNRVAVRKSIPRPAVYWGIQAGNVLAAAWLGIFGLGGLEEFPVAGWMLAVAMLLHVVRNEVVRRQG